MSLNVLTAGHGSPLLLLHGFTGSARTWSPQIEAWSPRHRVIAPDLLGHGGSDAPTEPAAYALERQARGLADLLALLEAAPATIVGYSMGARLALVLALASPDSVEGLILESPSAGIADGADREARRLADEHLAREIERDGTDAFVARWESMPIFASHAHLPAEVAALQRAERRRHTPGGLAASLRGAGQGTMAPLHDRLAHIIVPTVIITGALDAPGLARARTVAEGIPGARLEIVQDAGHTPHLESPETFIRIADEVLSAKPTTA